MNKDHNIEKWINNQLSEAELAEFKLRDDYQQMEDIVQAAKLFKASEFSKVDDFSTFKARYESRSIERPSTFSRMQFIRIAAAFVIGLGLMFAFLFNPTTTYNTDIAQKIDFNLPDQSLVSLNSNSQISFKEKGWEDQRNLDLNGEAYFKVAEGKTFNVNTSIGTVTVVGTEFNVRQRGDNFEVVCYEGKVKVQVDKRTELLEAGKALKLSEGTISLSTTEITQPDWINGRSVFEATRLTEVIEELNRQYDVNVQFNTDISGKIFSGGFTHNNLNNALIEIFEPMNLTFTILESGSIVVDEK